jgi:hypothetical protein
MGTTRTLSMPEHSGKAPYVVLKRTDGQYWDNTNTALGAYDGNSWADYAIDMDEADTNGASGDFSYTVPGDLPSGTYDEAVYLKGSDNTATLLDQHVGEGGFAWDGTTADYVRSDLRSVAGVTAQHDGNGRVESKVNEIVASAIESIWLYAKTTLENAAGYSGSIVKFIIDKLSLLTSSSEVTVQSLAQDGGVLTLWQGEARKTESGNAIRLAVDNANVDLTDHQVRFGLNKLVSTAGDSSLDVSASLSDPGGSNQEVVVELTKSETSGLAVDNEPVNDVSSTTGRAYEWEISANNSHKGTAQSGGSNTITLASDAAGQDDFHNGQTIDLTGGTGSGQSATITDYDGTSKQATVDSAWSTQPDNTTAYTVQSDQCLVLATGEASVKNKTTSCS